MPNRNIVIAIFVFTLAIAFAIVMFTTINQAPNRMGSPDIATLFGAMSASYAQLT
jgi:hypothetical protein